MVPAQRLISSEDQKLEKGGTKSFGGKVLASLIDKLITTQPSYIYTMYSIFRKIPFL